MRNHPSLIVEPMWLSAAWDNSAVPVHTCDYLLVYRLQTVRIKPI